MGVEPCTIAQVKAYKPESNSIGSGQVLHCPYDFQQTRLIIKEMTDLLALDLVDKHLVTDQLVLTVGYDIGNLESGNKKKQYQGEITVDRYGRKVPKHAHGTANLKNRTSSSIEMIEMILELYDKIVNPDLFVRRVYITANHVVDESLAEEKASFEQLDLLPIIVTWKRNSRNAKRSWNGKRNCSMQHWISKRNLGKMLSSKV